MSKLHTTLDDLLFPPDGNRKHLLEHIATDIEQHGIHYLDEYNRVCLSRQDKDPIMLNSALEFLRCIVEYENADPIDDMSIEMERKHSDVPLRTGWIKTPKITKKAAQSLMKLSHGKSRQSLEHIVRTLLLETGRIENINGPIIDGKLKDLVSAIAQQQFDNVRDVDTYSNILKEIQIYTAQSSKK